MSRRLPWIAAGLLLGFGLGGLAFRSDEFWTWLQEADWTSLPSATVGATVPAIAGVMFAQSLSRRSVRTLKREEIAADQEYRREMQESSRREDEARRLAWDAVYDACRAFNHERRSNGFVAEVQKAAKAHDAQAQREAAGGGKAPPRLEDRARDAAWTACIWGEQLRAHLPGLVNALEVLVATHGVTTMKVPLDALRLAVPVAASQERWLPEDVARLLSAVENDQVDPFIVTVADRAASSIRDLEFIASRHRVAAIGADEVNTIVETGEGRNVKKHDALHDFADLLDELERQ